MWVKICANTTLEDAQAAANLGADAVGFVFAPSARRVTPEEVGAMTARLSGEVERIGVFPAWEFEAVRDAVGVAGLSGVQMHGGYRRALLRRLRGEFRGAVTVAQTLHWDAGSSAADFLEQVREMTGEGLADRVLLDSKVGEALGGTGQSFDWEAARELFEQGEGARMIVAGGLKPENVGEAMGRLRPWGVDVASGVEASPGRKDLERMRLFLERVKAKAKYGSSSLRSE